MDLTCEQLRDLLQSRDSDANELWPHGLSDRKRKELEFHDADRARLGAVGQENRELSSRNRKFYSVTRAVTSYVDQWITQHAANRVFLDYACGEGKATRLAGNVAKLAIGIDISPTSVALAKQLTERTGESSRTLFVQGDCENTGLPDSCVDAVLCSGMLHHLDLSYAIPELRRIVKPGGAVLAVEALDYNPLFKAYRYMTPDLRTDFEKEHILSLKDVQFIARFFTIRDIKYWNLATLLATPFRTTSVFDRILGTMETLDSFLLRVPGLSQMAWMFTFEMENVASQ